MDVSHPETVCLRRSCQARVPTPWLAELRKRNSGLSRLSSIAGFMLGGININRNKRLEGFRFIEDPLSFFEILGSNRLGNLNSRNAEIASSSSGIEVNSMVSPFDSVINFSVSLTSFGSAIRRGLSRVPSIHFCSLAGIGKIAQIISVLFQRTVELGHHRTPPATLRHRTDLAPSARLGASQVSTASLDEGWDMKSVGVDGRRLDLAERNASYQQAGR